MSRRSLGTVPTPTPANNRTRSASTTAPDLKPAETIQRRPSNTRNLEPSSSSVGARSNSLRADNAGAGVQRSGSIKSAEAPSVQRKPSNVRVAPGAAEKSTKEAAQPVTASGSTGGPPQLRKTSSNTAIRPQMVRSNSIDNKPRKPPNAVGTQLWSDLRLKVDAMKKAWDVMDTTSEGLTPHTFKRYCKQQNLEVPPITLNNIMTDGRGTFGELLTFVVADMTDDAVSALDFDAVITEFESFDKNRDGVISGPEFQKFVATYSVPHPMVVESSGRLTVADYVDFKITGKLKNEKGLDGLKRKFEELMRLNKQRNKMFHAVGQVLVSNLPTTTAGAQAQNDVIARSSDLAVSVEIESNLLDDDDAQVLPQPPLVLQMSNIEEGEREDGDVSDNEQ